VVAHAAPDGYTLMIASGTTLAVNVTLHKKLPYDPVADFVPIALIARVPEVLVVNSALPVHTLAELKALTRPITFASAGPGTAQHIEGEMLKAALARDMTHVPYKGALPALNDVIGGHVTMMFSPVANALSMIQAGKVRAIGLATRERVEALPDIAPLADIGLPGFEAGGWFMLVAPAATPAPIVARLHDETRAILADPKLRAQFIAQGLVPVETPSVDELKVFVREQIAYWDRTLHQIGLAGME
jgi:tripartite-type tricarboxylate transporter receptor subunit TctC